MSPREQRAAVVSRCQTVKTVTGERKTCADCQHPTSKYQLVIVQIDPNSPRTIDNLQAVCWTCGSKGS